MSITSLLYNTHYSIGTELDCMVGSMTIPTEISLPAVMAMKGSAIRESTWQLHG